MFRKNVRMMDLSAAVNSISSIMGKISELNSSYNEAFRIMGGLSGALLVMTEFIEKRINDGNPVNDVAFQHMLDTLGAIEQKIDDIAKTSQKTCLCGAVPYGKWYIWGAPLVASCMGRIGSTKLIKQLTDLEGDLNGDIKFLELHMTANAVHSLHKLASDNVSAVLSGESAREFWTTSFGGEFVVSHSEFAEALGRVVRRSIDEQNESELSVVTQMCKLTASRMAVGDKVSARTLAEAMGNLTLDGWKDAVVRSASRAVMLPGHTESVTCMACDEDELVTASGDATIKVFTCSENVVPVHRLTLIGHSDVITSVAISKKHSTVVSGSKDGYIRLWDLNTGDEKGCFSVVTGVRCVECIGDRIVYTCEAPSISIHVRRITDGKYITRMTGHIGGTTCLCSAGDGFLVTGGANRMLKVWEGDSATRQVTQAHSSKLIKTARFGGMVASVSNREVKFHSVPELKTELDALSGEISRMIPNCRFLDACSFGDSLCLLVRASSDEQASAKLVIADRDDFSVRSVDCPVGCSPCALAGGSGALFVGLKNGGTLVYSKGEALVSSVSSASVGTDPSIPCNHSPRVLAAWNGDTVVTTVHGRGTVQMVKVVNHEKVCDLRTKGAVTALASHASGWLIGCGDGRVISIDKSGSEIETFQISGEVAWLKESDIKPGLVFVNTLEGDDNNMYVIKEDGEVESVWYSQPLSSRTCDPCMVMGGRFLVRPGYREGTVSVMDAVRMTPVGSIDYTFMESDPISSICCGKDWFYTLHGGMDLLRWKDVTSPPADRIMTYSDPVTSVFIADSDGVRDRFGVGIVDGSVAVEGEGSEPVRHMNHMAGRVSVATTDAGCFSVGVEGRVAPVPM